jgi:hypothetical protein
MKRKADTLYAVAQQAKTMFDRNIDTLVAAFLIRHPDVLPGEIELVMRMGEDRSLRIVVERKGGIQFPEELGNVDAVDGGQVDEFNRGVIHGWNTAIKAFHDINPPFAGQEMRSEPSGFAGDVMDVEVKDTSVVEVVGG